MKDGGGVVRAAGAVWREETVEETMYAGRGGTLGTEETIYAGRGGTLGTEDTIYAGRGGTLGTARRLDSGRILSNFLWNKTPHSLFTSAVRCRL